ncbi:hypothetical protein ACXPWS_11520 [Mycobacterium sp. BMJ-28]
MTKYGRSGAQGIGSSYDLPPIGSAEIAAADDEPSEFGLPEGYVEPDQYHGMTPPMNP